MNLWSHRFSQNTNDKLSRFLPSLHRAEILTIFCSYLGRNDDFINSLYNCPKSKLLKVQVAQSPSCPQVKNTYGSPMAKNINGPSMAKNTNGLSLTKNIYGPPMAKNIYGPQIAKIFMALKWSKILLPSSSQNLHYSKFSRFNIHWM